MLGMVIHLDHIYVKVTLVKWPSYSGRQILAVIQLWYLCGHPGQGHLKVKFIPELNYMYLDFYHDVSGRPSIESCYHLYCKNKIFIDYQLFHITISTFRL